MYLHLSPNQTLAHMHKGALTSPSPARAFKVRLVWGSDKELNFVLKLPYVGAC